MERDQNYIMGTLQKIILALSKKISTTDRTCAMKCEGQSMCHEVRRAEHVPRSAKGRTCAMKCEGQDTCHEVRSTEHVP
jgi:hypothetical protein